MGNCMIFSSSSKMLAFLPEIGYLSSICGQRSLGSRDFLALASLEVKLNSVCYFDYEYCTSTYGFEKEVLAKYGDKGKKDCRINLVPEANALCLGSLEELSKARRSVLDPPWEGQNLIPGDVLWSDPSMKPGISPNKERGIGLLWGPDCTEEFLKKFKLKATEERYSNRGAYVVLKSPDFDQPDFHSFEAITPRPKVNEYYVFEEVIDSDEDLDLASMVPDL
ncbi:hypothetical protein V6N13_044905 [Hibiscus sabdariffa]